jgi:RNA polymerase sigma-70 factor (sigma-E family)
VDLERQAQDDASFETFVQTRGATLTRFAYLIVRDHHLAQDLTQEGLARLHRHWARVSDFDDPDAYVRKIMLNQFLSWRRRRAWTERSTADLAEQPTSDDPTASGADRDAMWALLGDLPPRQRAVIVLRYYEDLDDNAIAHLLKCTPATVRSHASKATARLRSAVADADLTYGGRRV